jgi:hypothetical protein
VAVPVRQRLRPPSGERRRRQHLDAARDEARHAGAGTGHSATRWSGRRGRRVVARRGMGVPPRGGLGRADGTVSRNEQSKELGIFVGCRSVDRVDRGENVDRSIELIVVLEQTQSITFIFFKIPDVCSVDRYEYC